MSGALGDLVPVVLNANAPGAVLSCCSAPSAGSGDQEMVLKPERLAQMRQGMTAQSVHFFFLHLETRIISFKWLLCESCQ